MEYRIIYMCSTAHRQTVSFFQQEGTRNTRKTNKEKQPTNPCSGGLRYRGILTRKMLVNIRICSESSRKRKRHWNRISLSDQYKDNRNNSLKLQFECGNLGGNIRALRYLSFKDLIKQSTSSLRLWLTFKTSLSCQWHPCYRFHCPGSAGECPGTGR
jgi:hypothetical protein